MASAFSASMILAYARNGHDSLGRLKSGTTKFMHIFFPLSILLMFFSRMIFEFLYNSEFEESAMIFNTYLLIMISRWLFPQSVLIAMEKHRDVFRISLIELLLNISLSLLLLPYFGLVGIAMGTVLAFWFEKIIMIFRLKTKYGIGVSEYVPIRIFVFYAGLLVVSYLVSWV